jgi:hypothetical protein
MDTFTSTDPLFNTAFDVPSYPFGSEAANLEYSILSAILGNPSPEGHQPSDPNSTTPPPTAHPFSTRPSDYATSWSSHPNSSSLLSSEPANFPIPPFAAVRSAQTMFEDDRLTLPSTNHPQRSSQSSSSTDFLNQAFTSLGPVSSAHTPPDSFTATASQTISATSLSQSALHPLAPRWPLSTSDSAYVSQPFL